MKTKLLIGLIMLGVLDMLIPIPFSALLLIYVLLQRPVWFRNLVMDLYDT